MGCVIVNPEGKIVGKGYHHKAGQPHAEIMAMRDANNQVAGCTAYVTLEPCSHTGRTGPCCCEALIKAGIKKVVAAAGGDPGKVSAAVLPGCGKRAWKWCAACWPTRPTARTRCSTMHWMTTGRPFVALKYAMTLDGKIAGVRRFQVDYE